MFHPFVLLARSAAAKLFFLLITSFLFAFYLYGANLKAQWWIIDDHEIVHFLGGAQRLYPSEIFEKLVNDTEIGRYGTFSRFRPAYFFLRLVECVLWGGQPALWYVCRIALFAVFVFAFWFFAGKITDYILGGAVTLYMATFSYWTDIVARLGPSEIYAAAGIALSALGIYIIYRYRKYEAGWAVLCLGYLICSGSKENFVLFLLLPAAIFWDLRRRQRLNAVIWLGMMVCILWTLWIAGAIMIYVVRNAHDQYYQTTNVAERLSVLINGLAQLQVLILIGGALFFAFVRFKTSKSNAGISKPSGVISGAFGIALALYASQIIFYNGHWPNGQRYDFPGMLIWPILIILLVWYCKELLRRLDSPVQKLFLRAVMIVAAFAPALYAPGGITYAQSESDHNVARSSRFTEKINQIVKTSNENPGDFILIQTDKADWDYEAVESYMDFLRYEGVGKPIAFAWSGNPPSSYKGAKLIMARDLVNLSLHGAALNLPVASTEFTPLPETVNYGENCISIVISGSPKRPCSIIINGSWR